MLSREFRKFPAVPSVFRDCPRVEGETNASWASAFSLGHEILAPCSKRCSQFFELGTIAIELGETTLDNLPCFAVRSALRNFPMTSGTYSNSHVQSASCSVYVRVKFNLHNFLSRTGDVYVSGRAGTPEAELEERPERLAFLLPRN